MSTHIALVVLVTSLGLFPIVQELSFEERIQRTVDQRYPEAMGEYRARVTKKLLGILVADPTIPSDRIAYIIDHLDQPLQYARSFVSPYDMRSQGSLEFPPLPETLRSRQYNLELLWMEAYLRQGLKAKPLTPGDKEAITGQVDSLVGQVQTIIAGRVIGPFAQEAIENKLVNTRQHLLGTFEAPISENFPRMLSREEANAILDEIRKKADALNESLEVNESLKSMQEATQNLPVSSDAQALFEEKVKQYNVIVGTISDISKPLWRIFDMWSPEVAKARLELEELSKEVQSWRLGVYAELQRKHLEKTADKANDEQATKENRALGPSHGANEITETPPKSKMSGPEEKKDHGGTDGASWLVVLGVLAAALLSGMLIIRRLSRSHV